MGTLSWLNAETLEECPPYPTLWQTFEVLHPWVLSCKTEVLFNTFTQHVLGDIDPISSITTLGAI